MQISGIGSSAYYGASGPQADRITAVAGEFEAIFTSIMLKAMRKTVWNDSLIPQSLGEKIYTEMLDDEYSKLMTGERGMGIAEMVEKELRRNEMKNISTEGLRIYSWMFDNRMAGLPLLQSGGSYVDNYKQLLSGIKLWEKPIVKAAEASGLDSNLIAAVMALESGGNPYAVSRAGAKGLMQLMDSTARLMGVTSPFDPEQNIMAGARYLRTLLDRFNGDERLALASYNAGPAAVEKYGGIPPYRETIQYVRSVLDLRERIASVTESKE